MKNLKKNIVLEKLHNWRDALNRTDLKAISELYDKEAILFGTLSPQKRSEQKEIINYFENLFKLKGLKVNFKEEIVRVFDQITIISGFYDFSFEKSQNREVIKARYTFVFGKMKNGDWKIIEHHSSQLPLNTH